MTTLKVKARHGQRLAIVVPVIAALLAACSGPAPGASSPASDDAGATTAIESETTGVSAAPDALPAALDIGPLDEFQLRISGFVLDEHQTMEDHQARLNRQIQAMDEHIAACMAAQGFDYQLGGSGMSVAVISEDSLSVPRGSLEFAQTYGFGVSTDPWGLREINDDGATGGSVLMGTDPNQAMLAEMSDAERAAWMEALYGPPREFDATADWDWRSAGCAGEAFAAQWDNETPEEFTALEEEMHGFFQVVNADPRIGTLNARWGSCLADAGFPGFRDPQALQEQMFEEWASVMNFELMAFAGSESIGGASGGSAIGQSGLQEFAEPDPEAIATFTEREIALAVADWECRDALDFQSERRLVELELQAQFVDRHRAELEAWAQFEEARRG